MTRLSSGCGSRRAPGKQTYGHSVYSEEKIKEIARAGDEETAAHKPSFPTDLRPWHQPGIIHIIGVIANGAVLDPCHQLIDHEQRHQEPFPRGDWLSEAVPDFGIELRRLKKPMDSAFELGAVGLILYSFFVLFRCQIAFLPCFKD